MNTQERLRQAIEQRQDRLRAGIPIPRDAAILALLQARDRMPLVVGFPAQSDLISGHRLIDPGGNKALQFCLEVHEAVAATAPAATGEARARWAERFLDDCGLLAAAEVVLGHVETGFMRLVDDGEGTFHAWIATKRAPPSWRERADIDWWASWLAERHEPALRAMRTERPDAERNDSDVDAWYRRVADVHMEMMTYQLGYPSEATIGGCTIQTYRDVLGRIIAWALQARDRGEVAALRSEADLVAALASDLAIDPAAAGGAVAVFTLEREGAAYHGAVPGVAAAPFVRIAPSHIVWSVHGLMTEPWFFLTRELRRRAAQEYHNAAHLREEVFRRDLYALFQDKRFVTSPTRIVLRREDGDARTDIDAVVFDRKTGALGLFELKSQDPFARSTAELARQRETFRYATRQVSGALDWLNRHGGDEVLNRVDRRTAKSFRVRKVFPFVLGRYLAHLTDGAEPDRRAAWGTWPQILRLRDGQPFRATDANPLAWLFTHLKHATPVIVPPIEAPPRVIAIDDTRLFVHPSYAAFQASTAGGDGRHTG